jgi:hypothetical protein
MQTLARRNPYVGWSVAVGVAFLVSVVIFRRYLPYGPTPLAPNQPPPVVIAMTDTYLVGLSKGDKLWSVRAKNVEIARDRITTTIRDIHDGKIYRDHKVAFRVKAGSGSYNGWTRDLTLGDGIVVEGSEGQKIITRGARWTNGDTTLRNTDPVVFENKWGTFSTQRLEVRLAKREMEMWKVRMQIDLGELR